MHGNRTRLRQELEKQLQEMERNREENDVRIRREMIVNQQTASMEVPLNNPNNPVTIEVPTNVLEVRTKLAHPTNFHVNQVKKRQVSDFLSSSSSPIQQSKSAPLQKMRNLTVHTGGGVMVGGNVSITKDPLLSGAASVGGRESPMKTSSSFNPQMASLSGGSSLASPGGSNFAPQMSGEMGLFSSQGTTNITINTPDSPTMMAIDQGSANIQEQIIEDIMGLEAKFGDTLGLPYLESTMITPQTLPVSSNLFDTFGGGATGGTVGGNQMIVSQMSASCPENMKNERGLMTPGDQGGLGANGDMRFHEKERQKKNNHNMIERRRRFNINDRIKELGSLLPATEAEARQNKGTILKASVDYIRKLQRDYDRMKLVESKQRQLEDSNRQMRLRIQELELTARAHHIPTPSLTPETYKLAEAAEHALGSITPRSKSPGSANITPVHMFGDDLAEMLRSSPGMGLSKLQIKHERMDSLSPCGTDHQISPHQQPPSGGGPISYPPNNQRIGDIFSFNLPASTQPPLPLQTTSGLQLFGNT